jgi:hypothetical protein
MAIDDRAITADLLRGYSLDSNGIHGVAHWARVTENGLRVARESGDIHLSGRRGSMSC